jgi:hypothetical protein
MNNPPTLAQELRLVSSELNALEWSGIAIVSVAILGLLYAVTVIMPRALTFERKSAGRIVELLESIDRRLADRDRPEDSRGGRAESG